MNAEFWEIGSYVVTTLGLPMAIFVFLYEQRKERENEEEEVYQLLSDNYQDFLKVALEHPDLRLFSTTGTTNLNEEQEERLLIILSMLTSLFERAYLLLYEEDMESKQARRWNSWEDYIMEWCNKPHFRALLPKLLTGEDPSFATYIEKMAEQASKSAPPAIIQQAS
jgi:hypothetical protein